MAHVFTRCMNEVIIVDYEDEIIGAKEELAANGYRPEVKWVDGKWHVIGIDEQDSEPEPLDFDADKNFIFCEDDEWD